MPIFKITIKSRSDENSTQIMHLEKRMHVEADRWAKDWVNKYNDLGEGHLTDLFVDSIVQEQDADILTQLAVADGSTYATLLMNSSNCKKEGEE